MCECVNVSHTRTDRHIERISTALSQFDIVIWCLPCTISCVCVRVVCTAYVFNLQNKYLMPNYVNMCHAPTDTKSHRPCPWYGNWLKTLVWTTLLNPWRETPRNWLTDLPPTLRNCSRHGVVADRFTSVRPGNVLRFAEISGFRRSVVEAFADLWICPETVN